MTDFSEDELEQARVLFQRPATFVMGAAKIEQLPDPDLPEVAFPVRQILVPGRELPLAAEVA